MPQKTRFPNAALITGGAKRIGRAISLKLASRGYSIALHYHHSQVEAKKLASQIKKKGGECHIFSCDLSKEKDVSALIGRVHQKLPQLNLLVNNASVFERSTLKGVALSTFDKQMATNFKAPFVLSRNFCNICRKGQVINILDTHIVKNQTNYAIYLLSKKFLGELTKLSAVEFAPHIRVNGIAPGLILPPSHAPKGYLRRLAKNIPLKGKGELAQLTACLEFLIDNQYLTGQILFIDGGEHLL